ncbi:MAG: hypothetical protein NZT61_04050 [Deltaproteobacteria bacterium]|nr:hypothetical protein [Deltaproteobacteria bacterium]
MKFEDPLAKKSNSLTPQLENELSQIISMHQDYHLEKATELLGKHGISRKQLVYLLLNLFDNFVKSSPSIEVLPQSIEHWHESTLATMTPEENTLVESLRNNQSLNKACKTLQLAILISDEDCLSKISEFLLERNSMPQQMAYQIQIWKTFSDDAPSIDEKVLTRRLREKPKLSKQGRANVAKTLISGKLSEAVKNPYYQVCVKTMFCFRQIIDPLVIVSHQLSPEQSEKLNQQSALLLLKLCEAQFLNQGIKPELNYLINPSTIHRLLVQRSPLLATMLLLQTNIETTSGLLLLRETLESLARSTAADSEDATVLWYEVEERLSLLPKIRPLSFEQHLQELKLFEQFSLFIDVIRLAKEQNRDLRQLMTRYGVDNPRDSILAILNNFCLAMEEALRNIKLTRGSKGIIRKDVPPYIESDHLLQSLWNAYVNLADKLCVVSTALDGTLHLVVSSLRRAEECFNALFELVSDESTS